MGIRETLNKNPAISAGVVGVCVVLAVGLVIYQVWDGGPPAAPTKAFFSTDDGKTYFTDDINKLPPFTKDGKEAVKCYVYSCGKTKFVGYLEKYTKEAQAAIAKMQASAGQPSSAIAPDAGAIQFGKLVKKPGDAQWVNQAAGPRFAAVVQVKCPDGSGEPEAVDP